MAGFRTQYTRLNSNSDDPEEDLPPQGFDIGARGFEEIEKGNVLRKFTVVGYRLQNNESVMANLFINSSAWRS